MGTKFPAKIGGWTKAATASGPGTIYNKGDESVIVSFLSGSDYEGIASNVTKSVTKAGSGVCGSTALESNLLCYLKSADGVYSLAAVLEDTPLAELVAYANDFTTTLGTS